MTSSSTSGSDDEHDEEQQRLREAVRGIPLDSKQESSRKKRPSNRVQSKRCLEDDTSPMVSSDMQTFLANKLSEHLDSVYQLVSPPHGHHTTIAGEDERDTKTSSAAQTAPVSSSCVRLLNDSLYPISLREHCKGAAERVREKKGNELPKEKGTKQKGGGKKRKRKLQQSDSGSSESESEQARLREAAVDAASLLSGSQHR